MKIAVIDAQGAGLGQTFIKRILKEIKGDIEIVALGTNSVATSKMIKAGANEGIAGEKNILNFLENNDIDSLVGPIGVICSGGINGEITSKLAEAILKVDCTKYIIPLKNHGIYIPGTRSLEIKEIFEEIIEDIRARLEMREV